MDISTSRVLQMDHAWKKYGAPMTLLARYEGEAK